MDVKPLCFIVMPNFFTYSPDNRKDSNIARKHDVCGLELIEYERLPENKGNNEEGKKQGEKLVNPLNAKVTSKNKKWQRSISCHTIARNMHTIDHNHLKRSYFTAKRSIKQANKRRNKRNKAKNPVSCNRYYLSPIMVGQIPVLILR